MGRQPASRKPRRRGVAMILVMLAVAIGVVLSSAYVTGQSTSAQVAANAGSQAQARATAESALGLALSYVENTDNWRNEKSPGVWVANQPLASGTCTVRGDDGEDTNGDGAVEGDGSFTDDAMDMLTITATGRFRGTEHTVRAVVPPHKQALMIVPNPASLSGEDTDRYTLLRNWAWKVRFLSAEASLAEYDAAVGGIHVIYVPAHCDLGDWVTQRLKATNLPIVSEDKDIVKDTKAAQNDGQGWSGSSMDVLQLTRTVTDEAGVESTQVYKHYITSLLPVGPLAICSQSANLLYVSGKTVGLQALASRPGLPSMPALAVLESGALQTDFKPSRARRVVLPWGSTSFNFSIGSLNANGKAILQRSMDWAGSSWRGYLPGIAVWDSICVRDMGKVDGFDSTAGAYGGANVNEISTMSSNGVSPGSIKLLGGLVKGTAFVSPDADPAQALSVAGGATLTGGAARKLNLNVPILTPEPPKSIGGSLGDRTYTLGTYYVVSDAHFGKLTIKGAANIQVNNSVAVYCDKGLSIEQNGRLSVQSGSIANLYTAGPVTIKDNGKLGSALNDPTKVQWYILSNKATLQTDARAYAQVQTYEGAMEVKDAAQFFGTYIGKGLTVSGSGAFHVDTSCSGTITTMGGGFDLAKITASGVRWVESR